MIWLVLTIVLGLGGIGGMLFGEGAWRVGIPVITGVVWGVLTVFMCLHTVGQTQVGVVYNFSGTIAGKKAPGVVMTAPWQHIRTQSVAVTKDTFTFDANNSAVTKDQQPLTATLVVNYQITPDDAISLLKKVGANWQTVLLDGRVPQDFKEITAEFTSPQVTLNRGLLHDKLLTRLKAEMCPNTVNSPWCVRVVDVFISNVGYSQAYTNAIEAKQVQVQQALQAEAKVAQARAEAQQNVALAQGRAQAVEVEAKAQAQALAAKGRALRDNPGILQLEAIDKLNPNASVIICTGSGQGNCPSFLPNTGK